MISITPAGPDHWAPAVGLVGRTGLPVEDLRAGDQRFWVAQDGPGIVGVIGVEIHGNTGLVRSMAVDETHRHRGIAGALYAALEEWWSQRGPLVLLTETAEAFFARRGFQTVDRESVPEPIKASAEFRELCPVSARAMVKPVREMSFRGQRVVSSRQESDS